MYDPKNELGAEEREPPPSLNVLRLLVMLSSIVSVSLLAMALL